jgi:hypothetical protein
MAQDIWIANACRANEAATKATLILMAVVVVEHQSQLPRGRRGPTGPPGDPGSPGRPGRSLGQQLPVQRADRDLRGLWVHATGGTVNQVLSKIDANHSNFEDNYRPTGKS